MNDDWGRKPSWPNGNNIQEFIQRDRERLQESSVRINDIVTDIRNEDLPNTRLQLYH
jgi:hypothetical protein